MSDESPTLALACALIARESVTPVDAGCQDLLAERLAPLGFDNTPLPFADVSNLWSRRGDAAPLVVFAGHTDVVPTGPVSEWHSPPFTPTQRDGCLYGRGAADMKSSLAAMVVATESFIAEHPNHRGSIAFLITSDEEGDAINGTARVIEHLTNNNTRIDYCIVGEPSSTERTGDVVRNGRRGSLNCRARIKGIQGHVAYPQLARNPIHQFAPALAELTARHWDDGNDYFPPTSFQVSNMQSGTGATNVIPGELELLFNFRFNSEQTPQGLQDAVVECLDRHQLNYELDWHLSGMPFLTTQGVLTRAVSDAVHDVMGYRPELSTSGGTSDGRFIAPSGAAVVELGPVNATIHKINEHIALQELDNLTRIYRRVLDALLL